MFKDIHNKEIKSGDYIAHFPYNATDVFWQVAGIDVIPTYSKSDLVLIIWGGQHSLEPEEVKNRRLCGPSPLSVWDSKEWEIIVPPVKHYHKFNIPYDLEWKVNRRETYIECSCECGMKLKGYT